jgi:hypothetical protein
MSSMLPSAVKDMYQWATPSTMDHINVVRKPEERSHAANKGGCKNLREEVHQWATPRDGKTTDENPETWQKRADAGQVATMPLTAQVKCWPTICAGDYRTPPTSSGIAGQKIMPSSEHALPKAAGGKLNPRWVETLMGLPVGWTMPSCASPVTIERMNSDCLATVSSPQQQNEHSELF